MVEQKPAQPFLGSPYRFNQYHFFFTFEPI